jgi:hypothetical protein
VATFISVATPYDVIVLDPVVALPPRYNVALPWATIRLPVLLLTADITVPIGKATEALVGMVMVIGAVLVS